MLKGFGVFPTKNPIEHLLRKCSMGDFSLLYKSSKVWYSIRNGFWRKKERRAHITWQDI